MGGEDVPLAIDELPLVALLGCFAEGETVVTGAQELRLKESDRIATVVDGLRGLGTSVTHGKSSIGMRADRSRRHRTLVTAIGALSALGATSMVLPIRKPRGLTYGLSRKSSVLVSPMEST